MLGQLYLPTDCNGIALRAGCLVGCVKTDNLDLDLDVEGCGSVLYITVARYNLSIPPSAELTATWE